MLALLARTGLRLLEPWPLKFVLDRVLGAKDSGRFSGIVAIDSLDSMTLLTLAALALVTITWLRAMADYANTVGFSVIGNRVLTEVRNELYRHLQGLSLSFHTKARSGDLVVRIMNDVSRLKEVLVSSLMPLIGGAAILVGVVGLMIWLHWRLALVVVAALPFFWFTTTRLTRRMKQAAREQRRREGAMAAAATEAIAAIKVVQSLSLEGAFADTFVNRSHQSQQEELKGSRLSAKLERTVDVLSAAATALVLWYGARLVLRQELSPGDLVVFLAYLKRALSPVEDFAKFSGRLAKATASGERVLDLLEMTPEVHDLPGAVPAPNFAGAVRFERVSFAYEPGHPVLSQIDFEVAPGRHIALVGPSGIGKSTLFSLLLRLYDPADGRVLIDGRDIREFTLASLRRQITVVLQDTILFGGSVWENIRYGAPGSTRDEIEAAARLANAHEFIEALPQGYDTILGERGATLSGGQRQRIAIARAAIRQAPILILDEPTVGLDSENAQTVLAALDRLSSGRTTFFISHDLRWAARADLILYIEHGCVAECGTHAELIRANRRYAHAYGLHSSTPERARVAALLALPD
jgi:ATP-binding cassette subfamily B protein